MLQCKHGNGRDPRNKDPTRARPVKSFLVIRVRFSVEPNIDRGERRQKRCSYIYCFGAQGDAVPSIPAPLELPRQDARASSTTMPRVSMPRVSKYHQGTVSQTAARLITAALPPSPPLVNSKRARELLPREYHTAKHGRCQSTMACSGAGHSNGKELCLGAVHGLQRLRPPAKRGCVGLRSALGAGQGFLCPGEGTRTGQPRPCGAKKKIVGGLVEGFHCVAIVFYCAFARGGGKSSGEEDAQAPTRAPTHWQLAPTGQIFTFWFPEPAKQPKGAQPCA